MTKYRGKHNSQTRSQYIQRAFWYTLLNSDAAYDLRDQLHSFLCNRGHCVIATHSCNDEYSQLNYYAYHLAGATIGMTAKSCKTAYYKELQAHGFGTVPQNYVHLKLISNDGLDDIIQKITDKFPGSAEIDPEML